MSPENVENLRALLETWNRREPNLSLLDPDCTFEDTVLPDQVGESYRGHEGVIRAAENWAAAYEWLRVELEQIVEVGELLVSVHRMKAKARYTGIEFDATFAYLWTFRDGRIVNFRGYADPRQALQAVGLEE